MENYADMKMADVSRLPGVVDIKPLMARGKFAQALIAEAQGDHVRAAVLLDEAVQRETAGV